MFSGVQGLFGPLRRHPFRSALVATLLLAAGAVAGGLFWAAGQYRAAQQAFHDERYAEAERHIQLYLRLLPFSKDAHFLASRIARFRMDFDKAAEHLAEVERLQKGGSEATQTEWVLLRAQRGELDELAPGLWYCVQSGHPDSLMILETLAKSYMRNLRFKAAVAALDQWLELDPDCARALDWRGWVYERLDLPEKARADYEKALELQSGRFEVRIRLMLTLLDAERFEEAKSHLKILERSHPDRTEVLTARARCYLIDGNASRPRELLDRVLDQKPKDVMALFWRGQLELEAGEPAAAERWFRRLLKVDPAHISTHYALSQALVRQHRPAREVQAAKDRLSRLTADLQRLKELVGEELERDPHNAIKLAEVGAIFVRLGQPEKGVEFLHQALNQDPKCVRAHETLIKHYEATNQPDKVAEHRRYLAEHGLRLSSERKP